MLANILKANLSKKLISALVSIGVVTLNQKYNLGLDGNMIFGILGLSAAHITLQTIIDSIKANALKNVTTVVQSSAIPISPDVSNVSYTDMIPYINAVNTTLTQCFQDMKSGKVTDSTKDAMVLYLKVHDLIEANKAPDDIPALPGIGA